MVVTERTSETSQPITPEPDLAAPGNRMTEMISGLADRPWTARLTGPFAALAERVAPPGPRRDLLQGKWLGHALHPAMTDLPIGFWTSSMALDLFTGRSGRRASRRLIALGLLSTVPTVATGLAEWTRADERTGRVAAVHGAGNAMAAATYFMSWRARGKGQYLRGVALGMVGGALATASAAIGGHLAFVERMGTAEEQ